MIPKTIHLCWFGHLPHNELVTHCLESWKKILPDYEIKVWNEDVFDVMSCTFVRQAYEKKKWAFVSDYVRLYALYNYGGIYMDADVEVIKDFSHLLEGEHYVSSYVEGLLLATAFIACEKGHPFIRNVLDYYDNISFVDSQGNINAVMNPLIFTKLARENYGMDVRKCEYHNDSIHIFPIEYFMPYVKRISDESLDYSNFHITANTYTIHRNMASWKMSEKRFKLLKHFLRFILPERAYDYLKWEINKRIISSL